MRHVSSRTRRRVDHRREHAPLMKVFCLYRLTARNREMAFELSFEQFKQLSEANCHYCGLPPSNLSTSKGGKTISYSGVDRVDNSRGYVADNVVPCCKMCNKGKGEVGYEEYIERCKRVAGRF